MNYRHLCPRSVLNKSGPARFGPFTWMRQMRQMSSERLYFVGGHGGLATFTRKVMSTREEGSFFLGLLGLFYVLRCKASVELNLRLY